MLSCHYLPVSLHSPNLILPLVYEFQIHIAKARHVPRQWSCRADRLCLHPRTHSGGPLCRRPLPLDGMIDLVYESSRVRSVRWRMAQALLNQGYQTWAEMFEIGVVQVATVGESFRVWMAPDRVPIPDGKIFRMGRSLWGPAQGDGAEHYLFGHQLFQNTELQKRYEPGRLGRDLSSLSNCRPQCGQQGLG